MVRKNFLTIKSLPKWNGPLGEVASSLPLGAVKEGAYDLLLSIWERERSIGQVDL